MSKSLKILIVEDEILLAMNLHDYLTEAGHEVIGVAVSSKQAMHISDAHTADVAFVDIHLADGVTGIEAAKYISRNGFTLVIYTTANTKRIPEDFGGAVGAIAKPYTSQDLYETLRFLVDALGDGARPPPPRSLIAGPALLEPAEKILLRRAH